jgi:7-cyano-7-deazaguanine synthase in queuosine biosynthesis
MLLLSITALKEVNTKRALVLYSGGMDSVSLAWNLLEHTEQDVHIHAIHLHNRENRINAEAASNSKIALNLCSKTKERLRFLRLPTLGWLSTLGVKT